MSISFYNIRHPLHLLLLGKVKMAVAVFQIRRGKRENLGIILRITPLKRMLRPIIRRSHRDGSNEGSQHIFS